MTNIAGYIANHKFTTTGGGRCEWAFATKGGATYFLKRFLTPKPVVPGSLGTAKTIEKQKRRCEAFERRQNRILAALEGKVGAGGNLIAPIHFFQYEGCYYKVTEKVDTKGVTADAVPALSSAQQLIILRSAANSLRILHASNIVHGDLKTDNILIRNRDGGLLTASLIDFDDSYFGQEPPLPPEDFVLDPPYASPEVFAFIAAPASETGKRLTTAADIFSMGVVFHEYLAGDKPRVPGGATKNVGEAILHHLPFELSLPERWSVAEDLIRSMLSEDPAARPTIAKVLEALKTFPGSEDVPKTAVIAPPSRVVINVGRRSGAPASSSAAPPPPSAAPAADGKLRGTLTRKESSE